MLESTKAKSIISKIEKWVSDYSIFGTNYGKWYVGVTNDPKIRRAAHNHVNKADLLASSTFAWSVYDTGSVDLACAIETHFHEKGMLDKDSKGGIKSSTKYVYVYKKYLLL